MLFAQRALRPSPPNDHGQGRHLRKQGHESGRGRGAFSPNASPSVASRRVASVTTDSARACRLILFSPTRAVTPSSAPPTRGRTSSPPTRARDDMMISARISTASRLAIATALRPARPPVAKLPTPRFVPIDRSATQNGTRIRKSPVPRRSMPDPPAPPFESRSSRRNADAPTFSSALSSSSSGSA